MRIIQDVDKAIAIMKEAGEWMERSGLKPSPWWQPRNMNREFLLQHTEPGEFFVGKMDGQPAASVVLQDSERNQSWKSVDGAAPKKALYVHWLCVRRSFAGQGLPEEMIGFAAEEARRRDFDLLRLDTSASEKKLRKLYEDMGFRLVGVEEGKDHQIAFYQKEV